MAKLKPVWEEWPWFEVGSIDHDITYGFAISAAEKVKKLAIRLDAEGLGRSIEDLRRS